MITESGASKTTRGNCPHMLTIWLQPEICNNNQISSFKNIYGFIHSEKQLINIQVFFTHKSGRDSIFSSPNLHVLGLRGEFWAHWVNPCWHRENMQITHRKVFCPCQGLNRGPSSCETTVLAIVLSQINLQSSVVLTFGGNTYNENNPASNLVFKRCLIWCLG